MTHSPETWSKLLDRLAQGEALTTICRDDDMPSTSTVYEKLESDEVFSGQFRARRAIGVRSIVDDCLEIADKPALDAVAVADKRVRIDTRLRLAGKWLASEFGEKVEHNVIARTVSEVIAPDATPEQAADAYRRLIEG